MVSKFDLTKLQDLLKDFYTLTNIRITVFDDEFRELTAFPTDIAHFCRIIRTDPEAATQCRRCDRRAFAIASKRRIPYIYQCHAGLTEAITPLYMENILIGYLMFGHVFAYLSYDEGWEVIQERCKGYQVDMQALQAAAGEQPIITEDYILSASHILQAVAVFLRMERVAILKQEDLHIRIDKYIMAHYTEENMDVKRICEHFKIGKTYLYKISRQNYGSGIAKHILGLRIEKAKALLAENAYKNIADVAYECGFEDYNYFFTLFKRIIGMSPGQYRKTQ
ncbi:MAG: PocR ligand-binding domain-containing protein [Treponema sp.]|jgi:AraC-like DNA-binding protein|nr:PocR ligand-binding domain-containing protein [Treponema sp.]